MWSSEYTGAGMRSRIFCERSRWVGGMVLSFVLLTFFAIVANAQVPACGEIDYACKISENTKLIQANSRDENAYIRRADAYYNQGVNYQLAANDYSKVIELDPNN